MSNISANQDLFVDLKEKDAETLSGGIAREGGGRNEIFKVTNLTNFRVSYLVDGLRTGSPHPGQMSLWFTDQGGRIIFDRDVAPGNQQKAYNLSNGRKYVFRLDRTTADPYDINLYDAGQLA